MSTTIYARTGAPPTWGASPGFSVRNSSRDLVFGDDTIALYFGVEVLALSTTVGTGAGTPKTVNTVDGPTAGKAQSAGYFSPPLDADVTISGTVTFNVCGLENSMNANIALRAGLYRVDETGAAASLIAEGTASTEVGTALTRQTITVTPTSTAMKKGDRLLLMCGIDDATANMAAGFVGTVQISGAAASTADTHVILTETVGFLTTDPTGTSYWLRDTNSPISGAFDLSQTQGAATATAVHTTLATSTYPGDPWTATAGGSDVEWYTPPLNAFTLGGLVKALIGHAGTRLEETGNASPNDLLTLEIAVTDGDGTNPVIWARSYTSAGSDTAPVTYYLSGPDLSVAQGKRLRFRLYQDIYYDRTASAGTNRTMRYGGTTTYASRIIFPQTITEAETSIPPSVLGSLVRKRRFHHMLVR
jgi:hypothetical protein